MKEIKIIAAIGLLVAVSVIVTAIAFTSLANASRPQTPASYYPSTAGSYGNYPYNASYPNYPYTPTYPNQPAYPNPPYYPQQPAYSYPYPYNPQPGYGYGYPYYGERGGGFWGGE